MSDYKRSENSAKRSRNSVYGPDLLRVDTKPCSVRLHEPPEDVLRRFVDIPAARVLREVFVQWYLIGTRERQSFSRRNINNDAEKNRERASACQKGWKTGKARGSGRKKTKGYLGELIPEDVNLV